MWVNTRCLHLHLFFIQCLTEYSLKMEFRFLPIEYLKRDDASKTVVSNVFELLVFES